MKREATNQVLSFRPPKEYDIDLAAKQLGLSRGKLIRIAVKDFLSRQQAA